MGAARFVTSTFGRSVLDWEDEKEQASTIRVAFVVITLLLGSGAAIHVSRSLGRIKFSDIRQCFGGCSRRSRSEWTYNALPFVAAYLCHLAIHTAHFADNVARPMAYFEPEWLYKRYLLSTMEITFFFNIPATIYGAISASKLVKILKTSDDLHYRVVLGVSQANRANPVACVIFRRLLIYTSMSILTLMHYMAEPPQSFSLFVNFTIAGEGLAALVLAGVIRSIESGMILQAEGEERTVTEEHLLKSGGSINMSSAAEVDSEGLNSLTGPTEEKTLSSEQVASEKLNKAPVRHRSPLRTQVKKLSE